MHARPSLGGASFLSESWPRNADQFPVLSTRELVIGGGKWHTQVVAAVEFSASAEMPIDPYTLGALLGDGHFGRHLVLSTARSSPLRTALLAFAALVAEVLELLHPRRVTRRGWTPPARVQDGVSGTNWCAGHAAGSSGRGGLMPRRTTPPVAKHSACAVA